MSYYRTCPDCGAHLDLGEVCDCRDVEAELLIDHAKNELPGATNTEQLEGGTDLTRPISTSHDTREKEDLQV